MGVQISMLPNTWSKTVNRCHDMITADTSNIMQGQVL
jgi:hypothetical protein